MTRNPGLAALWALCLVGCVDDQVEEPVTVPPDHPCPAWGLPPEVSSTWEDARDSGAPVPLALLPPLDEAMGVNISQGTDQEPTHTGDDRWAWDLEVPLDTRVRAAAPGVVVYTRDDSDEHGLEDAFATRANLVTVDHGAGLYTSYVHLALGSVEVTPGQEVMAGEPLGRTGLSGQLTGPHLHFQVENIWSESLPARFVSSPPETGCARSPDLNDLIRRPERVRDLLVGLMNVSQVPQETFRETGVESITGLPGRLLHRGVSYDVSGSAEPGMGNAWILVFPETGGDALLALSMPVTGQVFSGSLSLAALPSGAYGWTAVATPGQDPVAQRSVRFTLED